MAVSGFYDCVAALLKYRSYQKNLSDIALKEYASYLHLPSHKANIPKQALLLYFL